MKPSLPMCVLACLLGCLGAAPAQAGCDSRESHQFDFWVGRWEVYPANQPYKLIAHSEIEKRYQGCAVRENWMPLNGQDGGSLNAYIPAERAWRQTWVDSNGAWVDFRGGARDGHMVLEGRWPVPGHPRQITRMNYRVLGDGTVEQRAEISDDGRRWRVSFDFYYRRMR